MKFHNILVIATIACSIRCETEIVEMPVSVETGAVRLIGDSIYLSGLAEFGINHKIVAHGFLIRLDSVKRTIEAVQDVIIDGQPASNEFEASLLNSFSGTGRYYARAFVATESGRQYGFAREFGALNSRSPRVIDFSPKEGKKGELLKIFGSDFGRDPNNLKVNLGSYECKILDLTVDRIVVEIPEYKNAGSVPLVVKKGNFSGQAEKPFNLFGPRVRDVYPSKGKGVFEITIKGENFSEILWRNIVTVAGVPVRVKAVNGNTELICEVDSRLILPGIYNLTFSTEDVYADEVPQLEIESMWDRLADKPGAGFFSGSSVVIEDNVIFLAGTTQWFSRAWNLEIWQFNLTSNTWTQKRDFPGTPRTNPVAFAVGNKIYMGLGIGPEGELNDFWEYDFNTDVWTRKDDIPVTARSEGVSFSYNGRGYFLGAHKSLKGGEEFWQFNPSTEEWKKLASFPGTWNLKTATVFQDGLFCIDAGTPFVSYRYDFEKDTWTLLHHIESNRFHPNAVVSNNLECFVLVGFPMSEGSQFRLFRYDPLLHMVGEEYGRLPNGLLRGLGRFHFLKNGLFHGLGVMSGGYFLNDSWYFKLD